MRAGIYARISEDRDETQLGVQRQVADCKELAARRGWEVADEYVDNDLSAYSGKRRPEYERMLADIADGQIGAVVVWHQDRLHRQPRELEEFFDVCDKAGLTDLASVSGDIDLSTHDGRLKARIMGAVARNQSDAASRRLKRKALEIAKNGGTTGGGTRPFGFEDDRVTVRPNEAAIIRELADRLLAGETLRSLCADLNERGIMTSSNGDWTPTPLRRMLRSGRISGQREHQDEIVANGRWDKIIEPEQTTRIRALLDDPSRRATRAPRRYLLSGGLLRCGQCGAQMVARPRQDGTRRYVCASGPRYVGCGKSYTLAEPLEDLVTEAVLWRLDSPELAQMIRNDQNGNGAESQGEADALAARLDDLAVAYANGDVTMREWMAARDPLRRRHEVALRRVARASKAGVLNGHVGHADEVRKRWPDLGLDRRRAIIAAALSHVTVKPGRRGYNRFDPQRFDLTWRY
jgi:DNA invertase Pin-like site-specific DNA recombinase